MENTELLCPDFRSSQIIPDVISVQPKYLLILFNNSDNNFVNSSEKITNNKTKLVPIVSWPHIIQQDKILKYYTLFFVDPDAISRKRHWFRSILHWNVINMRDSIESGETITSYIGAGAPPGSGYHRYVYLLYSHLKPVNIPFADKVILGTSNGRVKFNVENFITKYFESDNIPELVAGNFYKSRNKIQCKWLCCCL